MAGDPRREREPVTARRVVLSPPLRREIADIHARAVFHQHLVAHHPRCSLEQLAGLLTAAAVPPVRGRGPWSAMRVHNLMRRLRRSTAAPQQAKQER